MANKLKFGDANPVDPTQSPAVLEPTHFSGIDNLKRTSIDSTKPKILKKIVGPIKGIVLKIKQSPVGTSANETGFGNWLSSLYGDAAVPDLPIYYVRIPEFHSHLPEPDDYASCPDSIAVMYPEFITMKMGVEKAAPGDIVWVDYVDRENFTDPIYIGKIDSKNVPPETNGLSAQLQQSGLQMNAPGGWNGSSFNGQVPEYDSSLAASYSSNIQPQLYSKDKIQSVIKNKGYVWYDDTDFKLNIVGIRNKKTGNTVTDKFDDLITISYKENGEWKYYEFPATTEPGLSPMLNADSPGVARIIPGQYINSHSVNLHQGKYLALKQFKPIKFYRDANRNDQYDNQYLTEGTVGLNIQIGRAHV